MGKVQYMTVQYLEQYRNISLVKNSIEKSGPTFNDFSFGHKKFINITPEVH